MPSTKTLPNTQRARVLSKYRARGRANRNLWLLYSVKTDRDWILPSDRHFVLWLAFLESDRAIETFEFPEEDDAAKFAAVAYRWDGSVEYQTIASTSIGSEEQLAEPFENEQRGKYQVHRAITEDELRKRAAEAMRWLKVVSFAAPLRGQRLTAETLATITEMRSLESGSISDLTRRLSDFDLPTILGVVARTAIHGDITLDLSVSSFTQSSKWTWQEVR